ncbi:transketolase [Streptococcus pneumoniae]|uniref:transketolase n=1 Tax=Streptococcus pneumoniae TaxID=1313 RepID=UPI0005E77130|nr:transketolase [Streptococcus pneumoniae]CTK50222.1 transketolase, N-terminal subunit [Streptococcus pneumoniae]VNR74212.1 transketolase n-terminal section [Streptococcus pneumoniae]
MILSKNREDGLRKFATNIRLNTLRTLNHLGFGHYGGSLSIVEVLAVLYGEIMPMTPEIFAARDRDYFILSKGHGGPALYSTLYLNGFFDKEFLYSLNTNGTKLPSHPDRNLTPGIDMTTGSLGQGISVATGLAYGQRIRKSPFYTYAIVGDGELNEGQCWEAIQFASHQQLFNLIVFVDDNKKQLDGFTKDICNPGDFVEKFSAFGFESIRVKGSDIREIYEGIVQLKQSNNSSPKCIVLDTIKGQGVQELEEMKSNHHLRPTVEERQMLTSVVERLSQELEETE